MAYHFKNHILLIFSFVLQLEQNIIYFSPLPDAVSGSEDPLAGDQDGTTSVIEAAATLVLQGCLRVARRTSVDPS